MSSNNFVMIHRKIHDHLLDKKYGPLYNALLRHLMEPGVYVCWPSKNRLACMIGSKGNTVRRHLRSLEEDGLIKCDYETGWSSTRYTIRTVENFNDDMWPEWHHQDPEPTWGKSTDTQADPDPELIAPTPKAVKPKATKPKSKTTPKDAPPAWESKLSSGHKDTGMGLDKRRRQANKVPTRPPKDPEVTAIIQTHREAYKAKWGTEDIRSKNDATWAEEFKDNFTSTSQEGRLQLIRDIVGNWEQIQKLKPKLEGRPRLALYKSGWMPDIVEICRNIRDGVIPDQEMSAYAKAMNYKGQPCKPKALDYSDILKIKKQREAAKEVNNG